MILSVGVDPPEIVLFAIHEISDCCTDVRPYRLCIAAYDDLYGRTNTGDFESRLGPIYGVGFIGTRSNEGQGIGDKCPGGFTSKAHADRGLSLPFAFACGESS